MSGVGVDGTVCQGHGRLDEVGNGDVDLWAVGPATEVEGEDRVGG